MNEHHRFFSELTDLYASARPKYPPELFTFLFNHVPDFNMAWDCATGSGQAAISLAEKFKHVYASDIGSEQISQAFKHERITYSTQESENTKERVEQLVSEETTATADANAPEKNDAKPVHYAFGATIFLGLLLGWRFLRTLV